MSPPNVYFDLTRAFNAASPIALLASGQAVVFYRIAIVSKDGDWILREQPGVCERVLTVLEQHGATYRPSAPLDPRWLTGGWSCHFEFRQQGSRVRCDFVSRPPRVDLALLEQQFATAEPGDLAVVDRETLIRLKQTQRAKDYAVIPEVARQLGPEAELTYSLDPDRLLELAPGHAGGEEREAVRLARSDAQRIEVVVALAREVDALQQADRARVTCYLQAAQPYLRAFSRAGLDRMPLREGHAAALALAEELLPEAPWSS
ncbi:MAG: hypothetical protein AB7N76_02475 [Planctomycetota bacterium]